MNREIFIELVTKYLSKEITPKEQDKLKEYLASTEYEEQFAQIKNKWDEYEAPIEYLKFDENKGYEKLISKINKYDADHVKLRKNISFKRMWHNNIFTRVAASIVILMILFMGVLYIQYSTNNDFVKDTWYEKTTSLGQKSILTMLDGTKIILNAESSLKYPKHFDKNKREVFLKGEAYFEVTHDSERPFIVTSDNISTTVLGTKFNIKSFPEDKEIAVSLVEGSVKINSESSEEIFLTPSQQLLYDKTTGREEVGQFDVLQVTGWKDNILIFNNVSLEKAFAELERSFGVEFQLQDDSLKNTKIKANFKNESFWTIVKVIKSATGLKYKTIAKEGELQRIIFYKE